MYVYMYMYLYVYVYVVGMELRLPYMVILLLKFLQNILVKLFFHHRYCILIILGCIIVNEAFNMET